MITVRKRLICMLSAVALVLSLFTLLPEGALKAHALSGSGTESDPYIITTYTDLLMHTNDSKKEEYIKLANDITVTDPNSPLIDVTDANAIVHLDLAGHTLKRTSRYNSFDVMFRIYNKGTLIIDDSVGEGTIQSGFIGGSTTTYQNMFNISDEGTLIINGGSFSNYCSESKQDEIISMMGGYLTINDGDFYGQYKTFNLNRGHAVINGGRFYNSKHICKVNGSATEVHQFTIRTDTNGSCLINSAELISSNNDGFSNPAGITATTSKTENETYKIERFISENTVVYIDGSKIDAASSNTIRGKRILIYTKKAITGMRWEGTKLYWNKYPLASKYGLQIEKPLPGGGYTAVANTATTDTEFDFGMFFENNGVGKYRITVGAETDDGILLSLVTHSNTIEYDPRTEISTISVGTVVPRDGAVLSAPWTSADGFTIGKSEWYKGDRLLVSQKMSSTDKFTEGQQYTFYCEVYADEGYKFASDAPAYVNSKRAQTVKYTDRIGVKYTFTALKSNTLPMFSIGIQEPKAGEVIDRAVKSISPADKNITVYGASGTTKNVVSWARTDGVMLTSGSKFSAGVTYRVTVRLSQSIKLNDTAPDRLYLTDDTVVMIGGKQANYLGNSDIYRTYQVSFTVPEETEHFLKGDVNHDGEVDRIDANLLSRYVAGWDGYESRIYKDVADLNGDGNVDRIDANILSRCVADWDGYRAQYIK